VTTKSGAKSRGRKRRICGWALVVVGVALTALLVWSAGAEGYVIWGGSRPGYGRIALGVSRGVAFYHVTDAANWQSGVHRGPFDTPLRVELLARPLAQAPVASGTAGAPGRVDLLLCSYAWNAGTTVGLLRVAVWAPAGCALAAGWLLVLKGSRARRRAMEGACAACGYDLSGLGDVVVCPECGKTVAPASKERV
jgi:hypothetical protein